MADAEKAAFGSVRTLVAQSFVTAVTLLAE
jgi:hypothetical protein